MGGRKNWNARVSMAGAANPSTPGLSGITREASKGVTPTNAAPAQSPAQTACVQQADFAVVVLRPEYMCDDAVSWCPLAAA